MKNPAPILITIATAVLMTASLEGCFLKLSGAPCQADTNCPNGQYCDVSVCKKGTTPGSHLVSLSINADTTNFPVGGVAHLHAVATHVDGVEEDVSSSALWTASDGGFVAISNRDADAGLGETATGTLVGQADVSASFQQLNASVHLVVNSAVVEQILVSVADPQIAKGTTTACTATAVLSDKTRPDYSSLVTWSSSDAGVLAVSNAQGAKGIVTALDGPGSAIITAQYNGPQGVIQGSTTVKSTNASLLSIVIDPANPTLAQGTTSLLRVQGTFSDHTDQPLTTGVSWSSDQPTTATIDPDGTLHGLIGNSPPNPAVIRASFGGQAASTTAYVTNATLTGIGVTPAFPPPLAAGTQLQFFATGTYTDHSTQDLTSSVIWKAVGADGGVSSAPFGVSNSPGIKGLISAISPGEGQVIASQQSFTGQSPVSVTSAALTGVTLSPANASIANGTTAQFHATASFTDQSTQDVTTQTSWTGCSGQINAATGLLQAQTQGSCTITGTYGVYAPSTNLTVSAATLSSLQVTPGSKAVAVGTQQQFVALGKFTDGSFQDLTSLVTWSLAPTGFATISNGQGSRGLATATASGTTTVTATNPSPLISATASLTVNPATLISIAVTPVNPSLPVGNHLQLTAIGTFSDNSTQDVTALATWTSTTGAASVSNAAGFKGLLTGLSQGTSNIQALYSGFTGVTTATVTAATLASIQVAPASASIAKGTNQQFTAVGTYSDTTTQDLTSSVSWSTADNTKVTISNNAGSRGLAVAINQTSAPVTLTAFLSGKSSTGTLAVSSATLNSIAVTPAGGALAKGTTLQMKATGSFSDASFQDLTTQVTWSSSGFASISNTPGSQGLASGDTVGSSTITASLGATPPGSTSLNVTNATLNMIGVTPVTATVPVGLSQQYIAMGVFSDTSSQDITSLATWTVDNGAVASVSNAPGSHGLATGSAVTASPANVSATYQGKVGAGQLNVTPAALVGIQVSSPDGGTIFSVTGDISPLQYTAKGIFTDHSQLDFTSQATWASSFSNIASVTPSGGQVTLVSQGGTTISATLNGDAGSTPLSVNP